MADISSTVTEWSDIIKNSVNEVGTKIGDFLPTALGALGLFIVGLIIAKALRRVTTKVLGLKGISGFVENKQVKEGMSKAGIEWTLKEMLSKIVYWLAVLVTLMSVANVLGLTVLADTLQRIVAYVPNIFAAVIIISLAIAAGRVVKGLVTAGLTTLNVSFKKNIATFVEVLVIAFGAVMAATQLGLDTTIITANIVVVIAGIVAMLAISLGLGTKELVRSISVKHYAEKTFKKGQKITIGDHTGTVKSMTNLGIVLETTKGEVFVSNNTLV